MHVKLVPNHSLLLTMFTKCLTVYEKEQLSSRETGEFRVLILTPLYFLFPILVGRCEEQKSRCEMSNVKWDSTEVLAPHRVLQMFGDFKEICASRWEPRART